MTKSSKFFVVFAILLLPQTARADGWDYSLHLMGRTHSFAGILTADLGYGKRLWGAMPKKQTDWKYGFVRPAVAAQTVFIVNRFQAKLEFFPVSIFGFVFTRGYSARSVRSSKTFDCSFIRCDGILTRTSLTTRLLLGYWRFFLLAYHRWELLEHNHSDRPFAHGDTGLIGQPGIDHLSTYFAALGFQLNDRWATGVFASTALMGGSGLRQTHAAVFGRLKKGAWSGTAGLGAFGADNLPTHLMGVISVRWQLKPRLGL